jgi:hypothetical protein
VEDITFPTVSREQLRVHLATCLPADPWQQIDISALPVKHPSRARGFTSRAFAASQAACATWIVCTSGREERRHVPLRPRRPAAALHNRIETAYGEITDHLELARHGALTFWGVLTRAAALAAHTLLRLHLI